jgi:hypothetical protein
VTAPKKVMPRGSMVGVRANRYIARLASGVAQPKQGDSVIAHEHAWRSPGSDVDAALAAQQ